MFTLQRIRSFVAILMLTCAAADCMAGDKHTGTAGPIYSRDIAKKLVASMERKGYGAAFKSTVYARYGALEYRYYDVSYWPRKTPGNFHFEVLGPFDLAAATKARDQLRKDGYTAERDRIGLTEEWKVYYWK